MKRWNRALLRAVVLVLGLVCAGYVVAQLHQHWPEIQKLDWTRAATLAFVVSVLIQMAGLSIAAWGWGWILRALGVPASSRQALSIFCVSQFGKYLPGNVGQHVGRLGLSREAGFQTGRVVVSMFLENGFAVGAGAVIGAIGATLLATGEGWSMPSAGFAIGLAVASWAAGTWLLRHLLKKPPARLRAWLALDRPVELPASLIGGYFMIHVLSYAIMGFVLGLLLYGITGTWTSAAWVLPLAVTISWLAGFLTPGAPAGLGVREAALTSFLGASLEPSVVLSVALLSRVTMIVADVLLLLLGFLLRERRSETATSG